MSLIECVPNISEGRRRSLIEAFADEVRRIPGIRLLDYSADPAHNRSVFSFAGSSQAVGDAVIALSGRAIQEIDLRTHRGVHPRIGAVDVVPFVPLGDTTMREAIDLAHAVGHILADRWHIPVFFYEEAASRPSRARLEDIRRGEFEGLAEKMSHEDWMPDCGPSTPHSTAGATAVGARRALIAFNINLATDRLDIARQVAAAVRSSGGGLPFVKALGLPLADRGIVQVSMNLTNYAHTPIQTVFDRVVLEARKAGVPVVESELVGLIPAAALDSTTPEHLQLRNFSEDQILETRLARLGTA